MTFRSKSDVKHFTKLPKLLWYQLQIIAYTHALALVFYTYLKSKSFLTPHAYHITSVAFFMNMFLHKQRRHVMSVWEFSTVHAFPAEGSSHFPKHFPSCFDASFFLKTAAALLICTLAAGKLYYKRSCLRHMKLLHEAKAAQKMHS